MADGNLRDVLELIDHALNDGVFAEHWERFSIIDIAGCDLASPEFATFIDNQMQLEAIKPTYGTFATLGKPVKHLVIVDTMMIAHQQGCQVDEGFAMTTPTQAFQIGTQRSQH